MSARRRYTFRNKLLTVQEIMDEAAMTERRVRLITVCDACLRASCWHGEFMCEDAQGAGTVQKTAAELRKLNREHSDYFSRANVERVCGGSDYRPPCTTVSPVGDQP